MLKPYLILLFACFSAGGLFAQAPAISTVSPNSGPVGTIVTMTGRNFNSSPSGNIVTFGDVHATVTAASAQSLTVVVPAGAAYRNISVVNTANQLFGFSPQPFNVTFPTKNSIDVTDFNDPVFLHASAVNIYNSSVTLTDLDGDGKLDLVIIVDVDVYTTRLTVLRNLSAAGVPLGKSSFAPGVDFDIKRYNAVIFRDIDGDGKPDMLLNNIFGASTDSLFVRRNTSLPGTLSFDPAIGVASGPLTNVGLVADIDGDGRPDLVAGAGNNGNAVTVMQNLGGSPLSFSAPSSFPVTAGVTLICSGDIDGDGKPDIITANEDGTIAMLRNTAVPGNSSGSFFAPYISLGKIAQDITGLSLGDIDGDGKPDLVVSHSLDTAISVFRNTSAAGNISFASKVDFKTLNPSRISLADIDGDGKPDIIADNPAGAVIFRNTSSPGSIAANSLAPGIEILTGSSVGTGIGDLDGDGKPDLVLIDGIVISIFQNNPHIAASPTISAFAPQTASAGSLVTIKGTDFTNAISVTFGGIPPISFTVASPNIITAVIAQGKTGPVSVSTPLGSASAYGFVFNGNAAPGPAILPLADTVNLSLASDGTKTISLADIATLSNAANATITVSPTSFNCSTKGFQAVTVRATNGGSPATPAAVSFNHPSSVAFDVSGNMYVLDAGNYRIRKISPGGSVSTLAGNGSSAPIDGKGSAASFSTGFYSGLTTDAFGNIYVASGYTVRKITPDGATSTIAGLSNNSDGYAYPGPEQAAVFNFPSGIAIVPDGTMFVVDYTGNRISKVSQSGIVTLFSTSYTYAPGIATDRAGNLYVSNEDFEYIRKISPTGEINTISLFGGNPNIYYPAGIAVDPSGNIYVTELNAVARITPDGHFSILAGDPNAAGAFADGPGPTARFDRPNGLCLDSAGNVYVADYNNSRIRKIDPGGLVTTFAGGPEGYADGSIGVAPASAAAVIKVKVSSNLAITNTYSDQILPIGANATATVPDYIPNVALTSYCGTGDVSITQSPAAGTKLNAGYSTLLTITAADTSGLKAIKTFTLTADGAKSLAINDFDIALTSATCKGSDNGSILISAAQTFNYVATITGNGFNSSLPFSTTAGFSNLPAGTYNVCISVPGNSNYQHCYSLIITEPQDLAVYSTINDASSSISLSLSGGSRYFINLNGVSYSTTGNSISLPLTQGTNELMVTTDKLCQGTVTKLINISGKISPYPVPFQNMLSLNLGDNNIAQVSVEIHNLADGHLVYSKQFADQAGVLQLDLTNLKDGVYALHLSMNNSVKIFKIIKK